VILPPLVFPGASLLR